MPRRRNSVPTYRLHKQSGQAIVTLTDATTGRRRDVLLGPHDTPQSRAEYARVLAEWESRGCTLIAAPAAGAAPADMTVSELLLAYWRHAERHYRDPEGNPTRELDDYRQTFRPLRERYGHTPAAAFGPLALKALRQHMVELGWCRNLVNQRVGRIKRVFKWAVSEELVPAAVHQALATVPGLQQGRTAAREAQPVGPVEDRHVNAALPFLTPAVAAMVRLERLTGMRPGEVCGMRADWLDRSGEVWHYRPRRHKTAHKGKGRVVPLGQQAQSLLLPFVMSAGPDGYLFSPRRTMDAFRAAQRAARKTKVQPSQRHRAKANPRRRPGERYTRTSYTRAIAKACVQAAVADLAERRPDLLPPVRDAQARLKAARSAADRAKGKPGKAAARVALREADRALRAAVGAAVEAGDSVRHWHPNQLRHLHGTEVRRRYGLEGAQVALGHSKADVTQVYAERDLALAERIAREVG
jgi:integrase